jgi:hypothetical protein
MSNETARIGGCHCGELRYVYDGEPMTFYACHCTDCQTASGSAFSLSMIVETDDLAVTAGQLVTESYLKNGNELVRHHCPRCGTTLWMSSAAVPRIAALKAGTLDVTSDLEPVAHVWVRSAQPWVRFDDGTAVYERQPTLEALIELWRAR